MVREDQKNCPYFTLGMSIMMCVIALLFITAVSIKPAIAENDTEEYPPEVIEAF